MTLVRGLRGYGKTTEVALWLGRQSADDVTPIWVTASPTTKYSGNFESYLSDSLREAGVVPAGLGAGVSPRGFEELRSAIVSCPQDRKFVLVIDNFERVRGMSNLAELLSLIERYGHFYLYVCCQGHHPVEWLTTGRTDLNAIEPSELLFGSEEIVELGRLTGKSVEGVDAERLRTASGGCIALIQMALTSSDNLALTPTMVEEYVRTQLLSEIGERSLVKALMRFSLAGPVDWRLFRDLSEASDPSSLLEELEATGLVARVSGAESPLFTIPKPVNEVLKDQYTSSSPDGAREFHCRLAEWFRAMVRDTSRRRSVTLSRAGRGR